MATQNTPQPFPPGLALQDGAALNSALSYPLYTTQYNAVANNTTRPTGTNITANLTHFGTVASGGVAILPPAVAGAQISVFNYGANTLTFYGAASTDTIDGNASATLTTAHRGAGFYCSGA